MGYALCTERLARNAAMTIFIIVVTVGITALGVDVARRMAVRRGRSRFGWMWSVAMLGPLPLLVLGLLPRKRHSHAA
jgi:hypothetical protein